MIRFLIPEPRNRRSGGTLYDLRMYASLLKKRCDISIDWVESEIGIKKLSHHWQKANTLIIDGLVFHRNYADIDLLENNEKIYLTHLPFWLEPGIDRGEIQIRKKRETGFMSGCKWVICTSDFIRNQLIKEGLSEDKIMVIYPEIPDCNQIQREYKSGPADLLVVGSVHYGKGLDVLIDALSRLENAEWNLKIAGFYQPDDKYFNELNKMIIQRGLSSKIRFLGECDAESIHRLYLQSDILIHPSRFESFGMVVGEAICHGLPVIASDAGALPSVYQKGFAVFFSSGNAASLSRVLGTALQKKGYKKLTRVFRQKNVKMQLPGDFNAGINQLIRRL